MGPAVSGGSCCRWGARRRGRPVYAEIAGYGESFDAYSMLSVEPSGGELSRAISGALDDAGSTAADVDMEDAQ